MNPEHLSKIAESIGIRDAQIEAVSGLLAEGATVPFIARYRKEATGSLDEVEITAVRDQLKTLEELDGRKEAVLKSLEQHGHLTEELRAAVSAAATLAVLEDIYLPYRPKRRTKAAIAREKGLEPLALAIFDQSVDDPEAAAKDFIDPERGVESIEEALQGARHIIAEWINERRRGPGRDPGPLFREGGLSKQRDPGHGREGGQVPGLFRLGGAGENRPVPPGPGHAAGGEGGDPEPRRRRRPRRRPWPS